MCKISDEDMMFMEKTKKIWRVDLTAGGKSLAVIKSREVLSWDYYLFRKCAGGYKLTKSQKKDQPVNVTGRHQTICENWKRIGNPNTDPENIQSWHRDGMWHRKMCHAINETHDRRNRTTKPWKNQNARRKGNLPVLGNVGSGHHQTSEEEWKK